jgi:hypothetical protein
MLFLFVFVLVLLAESVSWPGIADLRAENRRSRRLESGPGPSADARPRLPESLEGVLVTQLQAGEVTGRQYIRAMERLAARDDVRHPLAVPPDLGATDG